MQAISAALLSHIPPQYLSTKLHQTSVGSPDLSSLLEKSFPESTNSDTLALAAYTLGDLPSDNIRREMVRAMWDSAAEVIVIIDRGTPKGFNIVATARDQLLRLGRHLQGRASATSGAVQSLAIDQDDEQALIIDEEIFVAEEFATIDSVDAVGNAGRQSEERGCHIVAPVSSRTVFMGNSLTNTGPSESDYSTYVVPTRRCMSPATDARVLSLFAKGATSDFSKENETFREQRGAELLQLLHHA